MLHFRRMADLALIYEVTKGIIEEAGRRDEIDTITIRNIILNKLEQLESSIAES